MSLKKWTGSRAFANQGLHWIDLHFHEQQTECPRHDGSFPYERGRYSSATSYVIAWPAAANHRTALVDDELAVTALVRHSCRMDIPIRFPAVICDVDGTLCDVRTIRHFVERPAGTQRFRANFTLFHSASEACPAFPQVIKLIRTLALDGYVIVVVTAREARWAELTERWLDQHCVQRVELITRRGLDYRPDAVVKAEICVEIQSCYEPRLAVDDRDDILDVWAAASIPTLKVGEAGSLSAIVWPGATQDYQLDAIVNQVRGSAAPSA